MSIPRPLPIPQGVHSAVWLVLVRVLRNDPTLAALFRTWRTWSGDVTQDTADPASSEMPWIRLTPSAEPGVLENIAQTSSPLAVKVEILLEGTRVTDAMDAWDAIVAALYPGDGSVLAQLNSVSLNGQAGQSGAFAYQVTQPTFGPTATADGIVMGGVGFLLLSILQTTQP